MVSVEISPFHEAEPIYPAIESGIYNPINYITNDEIEGWGIETRTGLLTAQAVHDKLGISRRFVASDFETTSFMAAEASKKALNGRKDIDAVFVTSSHPMGFNLAIQLAQDMELNPEYVLEVGGARSGFAYLLTHIKKFEKYFKGKNMLIASSEDYHPFLVDLQNNPKIEKDPSLAKTIFSSGARALLLKYGKGLEVLSYHNRQLYPRESQSLRMEVNDRLIRGPYLKVPIPRSESGKFEQDGKGVLKAIARVVPNATRLAVAKAGLRPTDIKLLLPHQPSKPGLDILEEHLPEYQGKIYRNTGDGNFSSASIPKALIEAMALGLVQDGDIVVFQGFGAGFMASVVVVRIGRSKTNEGMERVHEEEELPLAA